MKFDNNTNVVEAQVVGGSSQESGVINVSLVKQDRQTAVVTVENNMADARERVKQQIVASGEAKALSDQLSITNPQSIIEFGKPVAEQMSRCVDDILRRQDMSTLNNTSNMMSVLAKIMDKVDIQEIKPLEKEPGFFERMFNNAQKKLDQILSKYNSIGSEIEKVCVELRTYEAEISASNKDLATLYNNGITSYQMLIKYIIAGEYAIDELKEYKNSLATSQGSDPDISFKLSNLEQVQQLLEQRVQDLRLAETVALQSLPIIKAMEFGNLNLSRKINSSFIVTIPVFKNAIAQAVIAKRQSIQAQAMKVLDEKTNEMLLKNAQNAADNMRMTATLAGSSAVKVETIEQTWQTIMTGIEDTKAIQAELAKQRELDKVKIEEINNKFLRRLN